VDLFLCQKHIAEFIRINDRAREISGAISRSCSMSIANYTIPLQSAMFQATDEQDLIYGFFGLFDPGYHVVPNYIAANTIVDISIQVARSILEVEPNLKIFYFAIATPEATQHMKGLPSWVPDWSALNHISKDPDVILTPLAQWAGPRC
jgi:hypothetical protein